MNDSQVTPPPAPTRVRFVVVTLASLMATLLYLDRYCIAILERFIKEDLQLTEQQLAWFLSAFFYTYALAQVPSGWLTDRYGARLMLTIYILGWSLFTGLMGLVYGFATLLVVRALFGTMQAGAYPTAASLLSRWVPLQTRGTASGIVSFGGRIGGVIAPILSSFLMVLFVPIDHSSLVQEGDLLDHIELSRLIQNESKPSRKTGSKEKPRVPTEHDLAVVELRAQLLADSPQKLQEGYRTIWNAAIREFEKGKIQSLAELDPIPFEADTTRDLVTFLNGVIQEPEPFDPSLVAALSLPKQGLSIREKSLAERTSIETERLNRLVLEQVLPGGVRQVYAPSWRLVSIIYGSIGLVVAGLFWVMFRDRPEEHPRCNQAEIDLIRGPAILQTTPAPQANTGIPWAKILGSRSIWCCALVQLGTNIGWFFIVSYMPRYLLEVHRVQLSERAIMTSLPMLFGIAGNFLGGWLTDWTTKKLGPRWGRSLPVVGTRVLCAGAYIGCIWSDSPWFFTGLMCVMAFSTDLGIASTWAFSQDIGGRFVGSLLGWGNMWGNFGAAMAPVLLNAVIVNENWGWNGMFLTCALSFAVSGILALGIDASEKVD